MNVCLNSLDIMNKLIVYYCICVLTLYLLEVKGENIDCLYFMFRNI